MHTPIPGALAAVILAALMLAGCASTYSQGAAAYRQGRYDEAAARFRAALAEDPERLDVLVGLGLAHYQLGAWDEAIEVLGRAVSAAPRHGPGRLFLGLAYLQRGDEGRADEHLSAFRERPGDPRLVSLVDRTLPLLRGAPLTAEQRAFIAASLEASAEFQSELSDTRRALRDEEGRRLTDYDHFFFAGPWVRCR